MSVLSYLEETASKYGNKTAFAFCDEQYTFSQVVNLSRLLAGAIDENYKESAIAVICKRSAEVPILFFAAVYSGNYYIPIDPDMPTAKIQSIIDEAKPKYILGNLDSRAILDDISFDGTFLTLQDISSSMADTPAIDNETPLYMVYTSGSTGKPKGVLKSHGAVESFIEAYIGTFDFSPDDIIGNQTPFFFDASAKDLYLCLKTGATLEIIPSEKFAMPTALIEYLNEKRISFISWVPTALSIVAQLKTFSFIKPEYLEKVFFVGEVMPMKHLNYWRENLPDIQYVNLYGQSELAGICCYYEIVKQFENNESLPMGKALSNCRIYLLDNGNLVSESNHIGEMYIVSDALAICYFGDSEKTESSFLELDFGNGPTRCFKTGDLAMKDEDENFVFASRNDFQIKHMGHRIELGEIETIAGSLDVVNRCCALYNQEKQSIVLFAEVNDEDCTPRVLKKMLRPVITNYMMPEKVIILDRLPLNANGKINRVKLKELV